MGWFMVRQGGGATANTLRLLFVFHSLVGAIRDVIFSLRSLLFTWALGGFCNEVQVVRKLLTSSMGE